MSFAAVFVRLAQGEAATVAALRLLFSTAVLLPWVLSSKRSLDGLRALGPRQLGLLALSGLFLALHFLTWIASLSLTNVTSSIVFVTTSPLFVALYSAIFGGERIAPPVWAGIAVTCAGGIILAGGGIASGGESWKGDLLAVTGAAAVAGYFILGSRLRRELPLIVYIFPVYATAAAALCAVAAALGNPLTGLDGRTYLYTFLMAVICQVSGHSLLNWALSRMQATLVATATLGEPVGTALLAWLVLREAPGLLDVAGGAVILGGVFIVLRNGPRVQPALRG
ncbi:MAG: DMT family transporter [Candidatus Krumholzibacteria bacterium]|nr:DMT family transporter [Candidatus Krumholzibacteria bacterium]